MVGRHAWILLQEAANELLAATVQFAGAVGIRGVNQVDPLARQKVEELL